MSKILVLGYDGRQGKAVSWALEQLGHEVAGCDVPGRNEWDDRVAFDAIVSCLPYHQNIDYARRCISDGVRWADLGGHVQSTNAVVDWIKDLEGCKKPVATDLGLAPGLIEYHALSIIYDSAIHKKPKEVYLYCGGLPQKPVNALGYTITFSLEGLVNEYVNTPTAIVDGVMNEVTPMGDINRVPQFDDDGWLYGANTSGGVTKSFLQEMIWRNVRNCKYQTLRYKHHWELVKTSLTKLKSHPGYCWSDLADWIDTASTVGDPDVVYMLVSVDGYDYEWTIMPGDGLSAMQRGTAFPAAAAVSVLASGEFDGFWHVDSTNIAKSESFWKQLDVLLPR
jgi:saccharopine dehydrogenase-like NADP-dependent oxidoreductase